MATFSTTSPTSAPLAAAAFGIPTSTIIIIGRKAQHCVSFCQVLEDIWSLISRNFIAAWSLASWGCGRHYPATPTSRRVVTRSLHPDRERQFNATALQFSSVCCGWLLLPFAFENVCDHHQRKPALHIHTGQVSNESRRGNIQHPRRARANHLGE